MASTTRVLRTYDHRLRDLVRSTGDIGHAARRGVPRSTARGWLTSTRADVVTVDVSEMDLLKLQKEVLDLRKRVERLVVLLRLFVMLTRVSGFSLACARLPDRGTKVAVLRAIDRSCSVLPLRTVLRVLRRPSPPWSLAQRPKRSCRARLQRPESADPPAQAAGSAWDEVFVRGRSSSSLPIRPERIHALIREYQP